MIAVLDVVATGLFWVAVAGAPLALLCLKAGAVLVDLVDGDHRD